MIIPKRLSRGSRVAIVSVSSAAGHQFPGVYNWGVQQLREAFGFDVVAMPHTLASQQVLTETPQLRLADLYEALERPDIEGIIATIGGEDSIRLLRFMDFDKLRQYPKVFCGMSDITAVHLMFFHAGVRSYYSPTVMYGIADGGGIHPYTKASFERTLMQADPIGVLEPYEGLKPVEPLPWDKPEMLKHPVRGRQANGWDWAEGGTKAQGRLFGGCVEVICPLLIGTEIWPRARSFWNDKILFLEWSYEMAQAEFTRWFFQNLAAQGILDQIQGLIIGRHHIKVSDYTAWEIKQSVLGIVRKQEKKQNLPICFDVDFGHTLPMLILPYGALMEMDAIERRLTILDSSVV
ncbi:S66 family peptidase [Oligoflexus tunisiensis]|uniref:S66 family peptidase n=1 Tax=Oligoflexus tunisiensis TaxID=708132 RepID=UPI00114CA022|nr:S66 peptidase family protein [Oligoflexus tunisiensis]